MAPAHYADSHPPKLDWSVSKALAQWKNIAI